MERPIDWRFHFKMLIFTILASFMCFFNFPDRNLIILYKITWKLPFRVRWISCPFLESTPCTRISCSCLTIARISDLYLSLLFLFMPYSFLCAWIKHRCIVSNALSPTSYNSLFICRGTQVFPMLDWHTPIYGSPFKLIAFDLKTFPIDSYVQIVSKSGLLCCSFSDILTLVDFMQMNVHPRSFWLDGLSHPLDSLVLDIQLTLC